MGYRAMKMLRFIACAVAIIFGNVAPAVAQWQTPNHSVPIGRGAGITGFGSAIPGVAGLPLVSNGPGLDPSFQPLSGSAVVNIAALRAATVPANGTLTYVGGYYLIGDNAGGNFLYVAASTAADNGGTIIMPTVGVGRYFRQVPVINRYTPEMFGAHHDGTDDQPYWTKAVAALNAAGGGTLWLTDGYVYTNGPSLATGKSLTQWYPNVGYDGNGTMRMADNTNVAAGVGTGTCSGTNLTVTVNSGAYHPTDFLFGSGIVPATQIVSQTSGPTGGSGVYVVSAPGCVSSAATITASNVQFVRMIEATSQTVSHVSMRNITLDYNGLNNSCSGTCWGFNALATIQTGDDITVENVKLFNNSGSNDLVFGAGVQTPSIKGLKISRNAHNNSGDRINPAAADFSADFWIASNVVHKDSTYSNGPTINGAAIEAHGDTATISGSSIKDYWACIGIANETFSTITNNIAVSNIGCSNVTSRGVSVTSRAGATNTNISINNLDVTFKTGMSGYGVDACTGIDPATGINNTISVNDVTTYSDLTVNFGNDTSAVCVSRFQSGNVSAGNYYNPQGPGVRVQASVAGGIISVIGNQSYGPGRTANTALQAGVVIDATSAITAGVIDINGNSTAGTVRASVIGAQNASGGAIFGNPAPGATVSQYLWTGTGITPSTPVSITTTGTSGPATLNFASGVLNIPNYATGGTPGGTSGQTQYNNSGVFGGYTPSGDCSVVPSTGITTCLRTNGTLFGALATVTPGTGVATALGNGINTAGGIVVPSAALTSFGVVYGGGSGVSPGSAAAGTNGQVFLGVTGSAPQFGTVSGDGTISNTGAFTLTSIITAGGPTGNATTTPVITNDAKGRLTVVSSATVTPAIGSITGVGTGFATGAAINVGTAGSFVVNGGALGTPASGNMANVVGLPISTGLTGNGTFVLAALAVNVGSPGAFVVQGGVLGTPSSGVATNLIGTAAGLTAGNVTTNANMTGAVTSAGNVTSLGSFNSANLSGALTDETGSGLAVFGTGPILSTVDARGVWTTGTSWTLPAFTLGGTVSGGGNQINNVIIGNTTPLAGSFTTLTTSISETVPLVIGGTGAASTLTLESTSGAGTTDAIIGKTASQVERFRITTGGLFNIGPSVAPDTLLTVNGNAAATVALANTNQLHLIGADSGNAGFAIDAFGNSPRAEIRQAGGTLASKTASGANNLFTFNAYGWDTTAYGIGSQFIFTPSTTWTASSHPTDIFFYVTPVGSVTPGLALQVHRNGAINVGPTQATLGSSEIGVTKVTASGTAPGAGTAKMSWVAGTNAGSCKLISYAGTSTTAVTVVDNVGAGC